MKHLNSEAGKFGNGSVVNRVASVFIHVSDVRRSAVWYSRLLGLPLMEERLGGGPVYWFDFDDTHLILDSNRENRKNPAWSEEMKPRLMFSSRNIEAACSYLELHGEIVQGLERHGDMAFFTFRDPEGNVQMISQANDAGRSEGYPQGNSPIKPGIGCAFVDVSNMEKTASWYSELLNQPFDSEAAKQAIYSIPVDRGAALLLDQNRELRSELFSEICCFETDDFTAALHFAQKHEFQFAGEPNYFPDLSEFTLIDPDGNRIVIAQMH